MTMKAVIQTGYGDVDVLELVERPRPEPKRGEVLVRIHAADVTKGDARLRAFDVPGIFRLPFMLMLGAKRPRTEIPGFDFAGEVVALGEGATRFKVGDRVFGQHMFRCHAEYRAVPEGVSIALIPENLSYEEAVSLPFGAFTALDFFRRGGLKAGDAILVNGASGAVGVAAVQIAHHLGAEVTAVCSGRNAELVRALGACDVLDYAAPGFALPDGAFDFVFDMVGNLGWSAAERVLKPNGKLLGAFTDGALIWAMLTKGKRVVGGTAEPTRADAERLAELAATGAIRPVIDSSFALDEIREAHRRVDTGRKVGAVVVRVG
jgi:NADPH:quinone reductase-like Zn-dependent oxidoreductase